MPPRPPSPDDASRPVRSRGRPRDPEVEARILDAAMAQLAAGGYASLTIEGVASEAGVTRPTLYRRWPTKAHLAVDAVLRHLGGARPGKVTGDTRADLRRGVATLARAFQGPLGQALPGLVAALEEEPDLATRFLDEILRPRRESMAEILRQGIALGDVRADLDLELVLDLLAAPFYYRALFHHGPIGKGLAEATATLVWDAIRAQPRPRRA